MRTQRLLTPPRPEALIAARKCFSKLINEALYTVDLALLYIVGFSWGTGSIRDISGIETRIRRRTVFKNRKYAGLGNR